MNKFYYFSRSRLQLVEVKRYRLKAVGAILGTAAIASLLTYAGLTLYTYFFAPADSAAGRMRELAFLQEKLQETATQYETFDRQLDSLMRTTNELRVAANLPPLSEDETLLGVGGGSFNNLVDFLETNDKEKLVEALTYVETVKRKLDFQKRNYAEITDAIDRNEELFKSLPAIKPCAGAYDENGFGMRLHPILRINRFHKGIDIIAKRGTPIYAAGDGRVTMTGRNHGYGLMVEMEHGFGYRTKYAHLSSILVRSGQYVKRGDLIGRVGSTGLSTGPHLHYEVLHNGVNLDPTGFFFADVDYLSAIKSR